MKEKFFKLLVTVVLVLIVLLLVYDVFSQVGVSESGKEVLSQSEKMGKALAVAQALCPGERMSDILYEKISSAGRTRSKVKSRELSGWFECKNTGGGDCILLGLYRREVCADGGLACHWFGDNIGTFEFTVENSLGEYLLQFTPECVGSVDTYGCCVRPKLEKREWPCDWRRYELTYYGPTGVLNLVVKSGEKVGIWSKFRDKFEGSDINSHTCSYKGGYHKFGEEKYKYKNGELGVFYTICCPEGYEWSKAQDKCIPKGSELCISPAFFAFDTCWVVSDAGESCDEACKKVGKLCSYSAMENAFSHGMEENCEIHERAGIVCDSCLSNPDENSVSPYFVTLDDESKVCYYYDKDGSQFNCLSSSPGKRICPCKIVEGEGKCGHVYHEPGTCVDEDLGKNYNVRACTANDTVTWRDTCVSGELGDVAVESGRWLQELYCDGTKVKYEIHDCGEGRCLHGKCV